MAQKDSAKKRIESQIKKLKKIYQNYGIDISDMTDDEFERLRQSYESQNKNIDEDLKKSEKYTDQFKEDII